MADSGNESANPTYDHPAHDWNGRRLVERQKNHLEIKRAINAARGDSIFAVIHTPPERCPT